MIARRSLPLLAALAAPVEALAQAPDYAVNFRVLRNGDFQVGTHSLRVATQGQRRMAVSDFSAAPRIMGVVVYRYEHRYTEVTEGGRFVSVSSQLNRNGRMLQVEAAAQADGVLVRSTNGEVRLPPNAAPLSWWEPQRFGRVPLFGTTTGQAMNVTFERAQEAGGTTLWRCRGEIEADIRFDAQGRWVGFETKGDDGSRITYAPG
jgi:hypothetical protein